MGHDIKQGKLMGQPKIFKRYLMSLYIKTDVFSDMVNKITIKIYKIIKENPVLYYRRLRKLSHRVSMGHLI